MQRLCIDAASIAVCCSVGQSTRKHQGDTYQPMMIEDGTSLVGSIDVVWRGPSNKFCQEVKCLTRDVQSKDSQSSPHDKKFHAVHIIFSLASTFIQLLPSFSRTVGHRHSSVRAHLLAVLSRGKSMPITYSHVGTPDL